MTLGTVTSAEALIFSDISFEWADSYDAKDWDRLRQILSPTLAIDYTEVTGKKWDSMSAEDFVAMMSSKGLLGDPLVDTQHFLGGRKFVRTSDDAVSGDWQLRAAHQRYTGSDKKTVEAKGHGHAVIRHHYKRENGEWKLCGFKPTVRWNEFDFDKIFKGDA
ncbi:Pituitary homeobox 2 [Oleoguttula sp. CCFEE 5521]